MAKWVLMISVDLWGYVSSTEMSMPISFFFLLLQREAQSWDKGQKSFGDPPVQRLHHTGAGTGTVQFGQTSINFGFSVC